MKIFPEQYFRKKQQPFRFSIRMVVLLFLACSLFQTTNSSAQNKSAIRPPKMVVDSFHKFYPYLKKPVWKKVAETYEAHYQWGEGISVLAFDKKGNWIFRRIMVGRMEMPPSIPNFTEQNFPGVVPDVVYLTYFPDNRSSYYELHIAKRVFQFDSFGKIIREVDDD